MKNFLPLVITLVSLSVPAGAVQGGKETDDELLPGSKYKFAVLEYESPEKSAWGLELSRILTQEIIGSMRGISGVGVVNLERAEARAARNLQTVTAISKRQKAAVIIWGEVFEEGSKVYLHSHMSLSPAVNPWNQSVDLSLPTGLGRLEARPVSLLINFAPIEISIQSITHLQELHREANTLRMSPEPNAAEDGQVHPSDTYTVMAVDGSWMKIRVARGVSGWVRYANLETHEGLSELKAIVLFAQGAMHYFAGNFSQAADTLSRYLNRYGDKQDAMNRGLAHILYGNALFKGIDSQEREERIAQSYIKASDLMPNHASPINYLAILRVKTYGGENSFVPELRDIELRLINVLKKDANSDALNNLEVIYRLASKRGFLRSDKMDSQAYSTAIKRQMAVLERLKQRSAD